MTPKEAGFYMPAEWHPHTRCWMAWPCHKETWTSIGLQKARIAYAQIAQAIVQYEPVTMLVNPDEYDEASRLCGKSIQMVRLAINDSWTRDTGPTFLINAQGVLAGVDWIHNAWGSNYEDCYLDNQIASKIINITKSRHFHAPLIMEGGSFHVDGEGTILTSRECLLNPNRNPNLTQEDIENYLYNYLNYEKIIWLNKGLRGDETNGHIDEIACFIAPGKVLTLITHDKADANYHTLQENLEILTAATDARGRSLEIHTIEQPPATYLDGKRLTLSYINFYLANMGVVIPAFGHADYDKLAYSLFVKLFPKHKITQIEALDIFAGGGGIHCITQQQPLVK
ncbi:agmatine deiminase family protein [Legionella sp.]|uniref:agmatine deiminase family protein n=1 Tax=Legionella sp. TaxID=459 RepID=UPI003CC19679